MPDILDHVAYLSQEIGPRPAGTEEEQQAALYITEQMQKDAGLSAIIEDFSGAPGAEAPRVICCAATLIVTILALFLPAAGVVSIVVTLLAALLFAAEVFNRPVLSRAFARGVSQNVVAKYEPGYSAETGGSRRRKVIVVSRYDSGKVNAELNGPLLSILPILQWVTFGAMVFLPVLLIVRNVVFLNAEGATAIVLNVLACIALVLVALPLVFALLHKLASYNEGANCNAAGTAVMLEVARRVGRGRVSEAELAANADAAAAEEARRAAEEAAAIAAATAGMAASSYDAVSQAGGTSNGVPDWFKKAQEKAKKPRNADKPVQRSRFASALDAADSESAGSFAEASKPSDHGTADVFDSGSNDSLDVQVPQWHMTEASAADGSQRLSDDGDYEVPSGEEGLQAPSSAAHQALSLIHI